jgi:N-acetylneuraminic acid mutarotase
MPVIRYMHSASVVDGKIYIIGGEDEETVALWKAGKIEEDEMAEVFSIVYVYDPATDTWTTAAPHPFVTSSHAASVVDGRIYTIGGGRGATVFSTVYEYDPGLPESLSTVKPERKVLTTWGEVRSDE